MFHRFLSSEQLENLLATNRKIFQKEWEKGNAKTQVAATQGNVSKTKKEKPPNVMKYMKLYRAIEEKTNTDGTRKMSTPESIWNPCSQK